MILNDVPESKPPEAYIADVAGDVIERDWEYRYGRTRQTQPQGRPYNPHTDPHLSHICYYALADQPTGSPLYDEMFDSVRAYVLSMEDDDPLQQDLREVIQRYKHHHPGVQLPQER